MRPFDDFQAPIDTGDEFATRSSGMAVARGSQMPTTEREYSYGRSPIKTRMRVVTAYQNYLKEQLT